MTAPTPRNYNNTASRAALTAPLSSSANTVPLDSFANYPSTPFTATIDRNTASEEIVLVTQVAGTTLTIQRGYDGSAAQAHLTGAAFEHTAIARDFREANQHTTANAAVHGASGNVVGTEGGQNLLDKTLVSPLLQADTDAGDAAVAYVPPGAEARNLFRGMDSNGNDVFLVDATGNVQSSGTASHKALILPSQSTAPASGLYLASDGLNHKTGSVSRRLSAHWGSGTTFPATAAVGDTFVRSDVASGALFRKAQQGWRLNEALAVADVPARNAIPSGVLHAGFGVYVTSQSQVNEWDGTSWRGTRPLYTMSSFPNQNVQNVNLTADNTTLTQYTGTVDPGWSWRISCQVQCEIAQAQGTRWDLALSVAGTNIQSIRPGGDIPWQFFHFPNTVFPTVFTGPPNVRIWAHRVFGGDAYLTPYYQSFWFAIHPI